MSNTCFKCIKKIAASGAVLAAFAFSAVHVNAPPAFAAHSATPVATAVPLDRSDPPHDPLPEPTWPVPTVVYSVTASPV